MESRILTTLAALSLAACAPPLVDRPVPPSPTTAPTDPGYQHIERLQRQAREQNPDLYVWKGSAEEWKAAEQIIKRFTAARSLRDSRKDVSSEKNIAVLKAAYSEQMPTRYQDPVNAFILKRVTDRIRTAALQLGHPVADLRFGTLPTSSLNAEAVPIPGSSDHVILVHTSLFSLVYKMNQIALRTTELRWHEDRGTYSLDARSEALDRRLKADPDLRTDLLALLGDYLVGGRPYFWKERERSQEESEYVRAATEAIEMFVVAHEFGHVIRHHEPIETSALRLEEGEALLDARRIVRSWQQEVEADASGMELLHQAVANGSDRQHYHRWMPAYEAMAPVLFFRYSQIFDDARYIMMYGTAPPSPRDRDMAVTLMKGMLNGKSVDVDALVAAATADTTADASDHPPAWLRQELIADALISSLPTAADDPRRQFGMIVFAMDRNLQTLWQELAVEFVRARPEGLKKAPHGFDPVREFGPKTR